MAQPQQEKYNRPPSQYMQQEQQAQQEQYNRPPSQYMQQAQQEQYNRPPSQYTQQQQAQQEQYNRPPSQYTQQQAAQPAQNNRPPSQRNTNRASGLLTNNTKKNTTKNNSTNNKPVSMYEKMKRRVSNISSKVLAPVLSEYSIEGTGMVPIAQYKKEILENEKANQARIEEAKKTGVAFDNEMNPVYPPIELDDYLKGRYRLKAEEFKRLQAEQGFYFSDALDEEILSRARLNEGLFLMGVNLNKVADMYRNIFLNEQIKDKDGNPIVIPGYGDILASGKSRQLTGEDYDVNYNNVLRKKMGYRLGSYRQLKPETVLTKDTPFDNIIRESKNYTNASYKRISPASLLNMVRILDEFSKTELQWLRAATAVEVIYKYMSNGSSREQFFSNTFSLSEESLLELEEFFRTDNIFMTLDELHDFKNDLEFYRHKS